MKCYDIQALLSEYIDGVLDKQEKQNVEDHLKRCSNCQNELEELRETIGFIASLPEEIPPASFRRELRARLEKESAKEFTNRDSNLRQLLITSFENIKGFAWKYRRQLSISATAMILFVVTVPVLLLGNQFLGGGMKSASKMEMSQENVDRDRAVAPKNSFTSKEVAENQAQQKSMNMYDLVVPPGEPELLQPKTFVQDRKVIRTAHIRVDVEDFQKAVNKIKDTTLGFNGYITNQSDSSYGKSEITNGYIEVKVPVDSFDLFLDSLADVGTVKNRNITSQDVTEEYLDLESQIRTYSVKEERLIAILQKTGELKDILAVENELASTRAHLEQLEGRIRYLGNRTSYSTANIEIYQLTVSKQAIELTGLKGVLSRAREGFIRTINSMLTLLGNLIVAVGSLLPVLFIFSIFGGAILAIYKKRKRKKA